MLRTEKQVIVLLSGLLIAGLIYFVDSNSDNSAITEKVVKEPFHRAEPGEQEFYEIVYGFPPKKMEINDHGVVAGIVPHHLLAADMIASFYGNLAGEAYDTVVLVGPNHYLAGQAELIASAYDWQTPYGLLVCDLDLLERLKIAKIGLDVEPEVFDSEHAITSQVAFIKKSFPGAEFLPLVIRPSFDAEQAEALAQALYQAGQNKRVLLIASVDFTHYMNSAKAVGHDKNSIAALLSQDYNRVYGLEVDSPPAVFTAMKFAELEMAAFHLLDNSNSAILADRADLEEVTSYITGYFAEDIPLFPDNEKSN